MLLHINDTFVHLRHCLAFKRRTQYHQIETRFPNSGDLFYIEAPGQRPQNSKSYRISRFQNVTTRVKPRYSATVCVNAICGATPSVAVDTIFVYYRIFCVQNFTDAK